MFWIEEIVAWRVIDGFSLVPRDLAYASSYFLIKCWSIPCNVLFSLSKLLNLFSKVSGSFLIILLRILISYCIFFSIYQFVDWIKISKNKFLISLFSYWTCSIILLTCSFVFTSNGFCIGWGRETLILFTQQWYKPDFLWYFINTKI